MFKTTVKSGFPTILDKIDQWEGTINNQAYLITAYADITNGSLKEFYKYAYSCYLNGGLSLIKYYYDDNNNPAIEEKLDITWIGYDDSDPDHIPFTYGTAAPNMQAMQHNGKTYIVTLPAQK